MLCGSILFCNLAGFERYDDCQDYVNQNARACEEQRQHRNDPDESRVNVEVFREAAAYTPDHPLVSAAINPLRHHSLTGKKLSPIIPPPGHPRNRDFYFDLRQRVLYLIPIRDFKAAQSRALRIPSASWNTA